MHKFVSKFLSKKFKIHKNCAKTVMKTVRKMVLRAETKIRIRGGKGYKYFYVHLPSKLAEDSQFPFEEEEHVIVEIVEGEGKLVIKKREE